MFISADKCVLCGKCVPYCPVGALHPGEEAMEIDHDLCVECGTCIRNAGCPVDAFFDPPMDMPRYIRKAFSDPYAPHKNTPQEHGGRGTEEIKTNDVTGIVHDLDTVEVSIEMGRPGTAAWFYEVQAISTAVAKFGVTFASNNPVTLYMTDRSKGEFDPSILNERILSCIVEFETESSKLLPILQAVKEVSYTLKTLFSVSCICKVDENDETIIERDIAPLGFDIRRGSSKTNVGLGRPLYEDRVKEGLV